MTHAALLVIDMLNDFFDRSPVLAGDRGALTTAINDVAAAFRTAGLPVIWVRQEYAPDLHDAPREAREKGIQITIAGTRGCELLPELVQGVGDRVLVKKRYSAFFGTDLDSLLGAMAVKWIVVAGINTHACVRTTVVDAYQRDYEVIVAADCVSSLDREHHDVTLRYIDGKLARVLSSAKIRDVLAGEARGVLQDGVPGA
jgi:nicotinamidase-related amidase